MAALVFRVIGVELQLDKRPHLVQTVKLERHRKACQRTARYQVGFPSSPFIVVEALSESECEGVISSQDAFASQLLTKRRWSIVPRTGILSLRATPDGFRTFGPNHPITSPTSVRTKLQGLSPAEEHNVAYRSNTNVLPSLRYRIYDPLGISR